MKNSDKQISLEEAQAALTSLNTTKKNFENTYKPPLLFQISVAILMGLITLFTSFSSNNGPWTLILFVTTAVLLLVMASWFWVVRNQGVKLRFTPVSSKGRKLNYVLSIFVALIVVGAQLLYISGLTWVPYVAAFINASTMLYAFHKFPMGEWTKEEHSK